MVLNDLQKSIKFRKESRLYYAEFQKHEMAEKITNLKNETEIAFAVICRTSVYTFKMFSQFDKDVSRVQTETC